MKMAFLKYLIELSAVFIGVFAAFYLSNYQLEQVSNNRKKEIYRAIYTDLERFCMAGDSTNPEGFIQLFRGQKMLLDSSIQKREMAANIRIYGDFWHIEMINSMLNSGILNEIDLETLGLISRFHTVHQNFLTCIQEYNQFYQNEITHNFQNNPDHYFEKEKPILLPQYQPLQQYTAQMSNFSELLVDFAKQIKEQIKDRHLSE